MLSLIHPNQLKSVTPEYSVDIRTMVFDTETTGLMPKKYDSLDQCPYILQLSYVIWEDGRVIKTFNQYIKIDDSIPISDEITRITGITRANTDVGISIVDALTEFYADYMQCRIIVAHNIKFDQAMIQTEIKRNETALIACPCVFDPIYNSIYGIQMCCTMNAGKMRCDVYVELSGGRRFKKAPKLGELYQKLFNCMPANLHNSLIDTLVCLRCYLKMKDVNMDDAYFASLLVL